MIEKTLRFIYKFAAFSTGLAVFFVTTVSVFVFAYYYERNQRDYLEQELLGLAGAAANLIDGDLHNQIRNPDQINGEAYARAVKPLVDLHNAYPQITYLYTMIEQEDGVYFILDTAADPRLVTQKDLDASSVMEAYEIESIGDSQWLQAMRAGDSYVNHEFVVDKYGAFISGSAPFYDSQGNYAGFVGVDYDVSLVLERHWQTYLTVAISLGAGMLLSFLVGAFVYYLKAKRENDLRARRKLEKKLKKTSKLLDAAMNAIDQGFVVWDDDTQLVIWNERFRELWGYPEGFLRRGLPLIDLHRYQAALGTFGPGDVEEVAQLRLQKSYPKDDAGPTSDYFTPPNGRMLYVARSYVEDLGWLSTYTEVTNLIDGAGEARKH